MPTDTPASAATCRTVVAAIPSRSATAHSASAIRPRRSWWSTCFGTRVTIQRIGTRGRSPMPIAHNGDIEIAYELVDDTGPNPMLLLSGSSAQMIPSPPELLDGLVARGFAVAHLDNRDSGRSTHCAGLPQYTL